MPTTAPKTSAALARFPRVTLGVSLLSALIALAVSLGFGARMHEADRELSDAVALFVRHPMLRIPARFEPVLEDRMPDFEGNAAFDFLKGKNDPARQAELDAAVARGLAELDAHPQRVLGFVPARPRLASWILHPLVHASLWHWIAVLLPFAFVAGSAERIWGWRTLAAFLPAASLASAVSFHLLGSDCDRPLLGLGASTAALAGAIAYRARDARVDLFAWVPAETGLSWKLPGFALGGVWALGELAAWILPSGPLPASLTAHPALGTQLAAAVLGALAAFAAERSGLESRLDAGGPAAAPAAARATRNSREALEQARAARADSKLDRAIEILRAEARRVPGHREVVLELWETASLRGTASDAYPAMQALIASELRRGALDEAVAHWKRLVQVERNNSIGADLLLQLLPRIRQRCGGNEHELALGQLLSDRKVRGDAELLLRVAEPAIHCGGARARQAAEALAELRNLTPELQRRADELVRRVGLTSQEVVEASAASAIAAGESDAFYAEQDRSAFGEIDPATELTERTVLREDGTLAEPALFPSVSSRSGVPLALQDEGIVLEIEGRGRRKLAYSRVRRVAFAGVRGLAAKPVLVVDLLLSDPKPAEAPLEIVRLRSDAFDPLRLAPNADGALQALVTFVIELARRAQVDVVPPNASGRVETFASLDDYQHRVLRVRGPARSEPNAD
jgi:membrane associated rhomboid family serine protease